MKTEEERRPGGIGKLKRSQTAELEETAERKAGKTAKPEKAGGGQTGETAEIQGDGKRKGAGQMLPVAAHSARKQTPISRIAHLIDITSAAARRRTIREKLPAPLRLPSP